MLKQRNLKYGNRVFIVSYADIVAIGAATSGSINLPLILPAGAIVTQTLVKDTVQFAAPSLSALTVQIADATTHVYGSGTLNIFTAPSAEKFISDIVGFRTRLGSTTQMSLNFTSTGANLNALTAGELQVVINYTGSNIVVAGGQFL